MALGMGMGLGFGNGAHDDMSIPARITLNVARAKPAYTNPATYGGLVLSPETLGTNGSNIVTWANNVGGSPASAASGHQPTVGTWVDGVQKCAVFNSAHPDYFTCPTGIGPITEVGPASTVWAISYIATTGGANTMLSMFASGQPAILDMFLHGYSTVEMTHFFNNTGLYTHSGVQTLPARNACFGATVRGGTSGNSEDGSCIQVCAGGYQVYRGQANYEDVSMTANDTALVGAANLSGANPHTGSILALGVHPVPLSDSQILAIANSYNAAPLNIYCDGNSITYGYGGTPYPTQLATLFNSNGKQQNIINNGAVSASRTLECLARYYGQWLSGDVSPRGKFSPYAQNFFVAWEGTNDLYYGATFAQTQANLLKWIAQIATDGWIPLNLTILARSTFSGATETARQAINTWLTTQAGLTAGFIVDVASRSEFSNPLNATYFVDGTHPTTAGYLIIARCVRAAILAIINAAPGTSPSVIQAAITAAVAIA